MLVHESYEKMQNFLAYIKYILYHCGKFAKCFFLTNNINP